MQQVERRMIRPVFTMIAALGGLAACMTTLAPQVVARLGPDPALGGGRYTSGGGITVATDIREQNGRTMVCGVWAQSRQQSTLTNGVEPKVLGSGNVSLGGETLVRGLLFMREVPPVADYGGSEAGCIVSDRVWQAGDDARQPVVRIPRQQVHVEGDEGGHLVVYFKPTGPAAGAP
ncbi:hypothetical protein RA2_00206 [Roseovarius sp. A-2]|uniref:hypothetical protein n=1 Tax=Roseovarius sp. A-2 TaxID=1570360 RepID=UPI0009CF2049|nr:hypothetical protein [Roseovarius sp. A-2]GAW33170.1 hypothetical protein RA2_00206 [Roseovarius sp. A-2]